MQRRVLHKRMAIVALLLLLIQIVPAGAITPAQVQAAQGGNGNGQGNLYGQGHKITNAERKAAAQRAKSSRQALGIAAAAATPNPGGTPDYFGTIPNYANSPLPPVVTITGDGTGAAAVATVQNGQITAIQVTNGGSGYTAASVSISAIDGSGAQATATVSNGAVTAITVSQAGSGYVGIRKFVDSLPGLGASNANDLGQYMPVAVADTTTYPGSDYFEIAVVQYIQQMHKDLPPTTLRGYVQLETSEVHGNHVPLTYPNGAPILNASGQQVFAVDNPQYLGPVIIAQRNVPTRVKFTNYLPTGSGGDLFIPVDTTDMGAGPGPKHADGTPCDSSVDNTCAYFTQNRATLHLHGGITPWISDGTPHQWTTPAGENSPYPEGVSVKNVPDMPDPGPGSLTFFYSNQQSARLMFYHDHSYGITRLNVYAGEAAGYVLQDPVEQQLVSQGIIPADQVPLVIQDKTFVPGPNQLAAEDPTWNKLGFGNLWFPHVYMPNQNPWDLGGANPMGRWDYGPWFWPPWNPTYGEQPNPYYDPINAPWEPPMIPGVPNTSLVPEGFMDTPLVNGTAYPFLAVQPKAYRFRILNASNDRTLNLQLYYARSNAPMWNADGTLNDANAGEVPMVAAVTGQPGTAGYPPDITDGRDGGVPDVRAKGPDMIQIGTEGGVLPAPVALHNTPVGYEYNRRSVTVLNVSTKNLMLGPAERADVIVDFSNVPAGSKLILYNDAPAPVPAFDTRYDYYTGNPDQTDTGGAPTTLPGYGPNTRTIMQFQVAGTPAPAFNQTALNNAFASTANSTGAFAATQDPIIVPQAPYNSAYNANFPAGPVGVYGRIQDTQITFTPAGSGSPLTIPFQPKAIQELFENDYGRMNATLGVEIPNTNGTNQTTIPYGYIDPTTEDLRDSITPMSPVAGDGTQIWKITHNGVDTHAIHFHLFNVQLVNRVGWDGAIKPPDLNELGWKDTVRMNPLEDAIVALRPIAPKSPFGVPNSIRPYDVTRPLGSTMGFTNIDTNGNPITPGITNQLVNFYWEYVWHCHLLGHEENDMMRPIAFRVTSALPPAPVLIYTRTAQPVNLSWTDFTPASPSWGQPGSTWGDPGNEIGFNIMRADVDQNGVVGAYSQIGTALANQTTYTDANASTTIAQSYKVVPWNVAGETPSNELLVPQPTFLNPTSPTGLTAVLQAGPQVLLNWNDTANNEDGFLVQRSDNGGPFTTLQAGGLPANPGIGPMSFTDTTVQAGNHYTYQVVAWNNFAQALSNQASVDVLVPASPTALSATLQSGPAVGLAWTDSGGTQTGYVVERAANGGAFSQLTTLAAHSSSYTDNSVVLGTNYTYQVRAVNLAGQSAPSNSITIHVSVPADPTALTATLANGSQVGLAWTDNADNESSYTIARSVNGGGFVLLTTVQANPGTGPMSFTDTTTQPGNSYTYQVTAVNILGSSAAASSGAVSVPPSAPTGLVANLANPGVPPVNLTWTGPANATSFIIERAANGSQTFTQIGTSTTASYTDSSAVEGNSYTYQVKAVNTAGTSVPSQSASIFVPPAAPSNLTATVPNQAQAQVLLGWTDNSNNEAGFVLERSADNGANYPVTFPLSSHSGTGPMSFTDSTVAAGGSYVYRVRAVTNLGDSNYSNTAAVTLPAAPTAPSGLTATVQNGQVTLTWIDNSNNETGFPIQRSVNGGAFTLLATAPPNPSQAPSQVSYIDSTVTAGNSYSYKVAAQNGVGTSIYSNPATALLPPAAPTNLVATPQNGPAPGFAPQVSLSWTDVATNNETGYIVERLTTGQVFATVATLAAHATSYLDTSVLPNTSYTYRVTVQSPGGNVSSNNANAALPPVPAAPSNVSGQTSRNVTTDNVVLTWRDNSNNETGFFIQRATTSSFTAGLTNLPIQAANTTRYTDTGLARNTNYYYRILAFNLGGVSAWTRTFNIRTP